MKRVFALITLLSIFISLFAGTTAFAASEAFVRVDVSASDKTYNAGGTVNVFISLEDIALDKGDGISAFEFVLNYDKEKVVPVVSASADDDGDNWNFFELVSSSPLDWEAMGKLDTENGYYELAFAEFTGDHLVVNNNTLKIKIPFTVKEDTKVDDIVFSVNSICAYDSTLHKTYSPANISIVMTYSLQPDELVTVPEDAFGIDYAGFKDDENVIRYAFEETTVGDYIANCRNDNDMSEYGIIIVDENGVITNVDLSDADKSSVVIPADSYLIGVHSSSPDYEAFVKAAKVDSIVTLYNVNIEATGKVAVMSALENVGFTIDDPSLKVKEGMTIKYDEENAELKVYGANININDFKNMFENENITVLDKNGNEVTSGLVKTGMTVDYGDGVKVLIMGDVDYNGKINALDYAQVKRHIIGTMVLTGDSYKAAFVTGSKKLRATDYAAIKRHVIGTVNIIAYFK